MKKLFIILILGLTSVLFLSENTLAQDSNGNLVTITEVTVKPGHRAQYEEGMKLLKACYVKNKSTEHWSVWHRVQGFGNAYELVGFMANWAEMDKTDPADNACSTTLANFVQPHIESINYTIARDMPEISEPQSGEAKVIDVTFFKVKSRSAFKDVIKSIAVALKTSEGSERGYWSRVIGGGPDAPGYFVVEPKANFAALDKKSDSPLQVYEKVNGKKAADALSAKANNAVDKAWSYLYVLDKDLSD